LDNIGHLVLYENFMQNFNETFMLLFLNMPISRCSRVSLKNIPPKLWYANFDHWNLKILTGQKIRVNKN
jgi:hypothetical protein